MGRPQKLKVLSLSLSTKALEERLTRDPDHLSDRDSFAKKLDHLLSKAMEMGVSKKEIVELLLEYHKGAGLDVQRAFVEDAVAFAFDAIQASVGGAAQPEASKSARDQKRETIVSRNEDGPKLPQPEPPGDESHESCTPEQGIVEAPAQKGGVQSQLQPPSEPPGLHRGGIGETIRLEQPIDTSVIEAKLGNPDHIEELEQRAIGRHDGKLIFATDVDASEYMYLTGTECYVSGKGSP